MKHVPFSKGGESDAEEYLTEEQAKEEEENRIRAEARTLNRALGEQEEQSLRAREAQREANPHTLQLSDAKAIQNLDGLQ